MPSQTALCNKALRRLGENPILAVDNETTWGRRCNAALPEVIRTVLAMDAWRSCTTRANLAADSETPIGYSAAYTLPRDCVRLVAIAKSQYDDWSLEGNKILCNNDKSTALQIMYVREVSDTNLFSPLLYDVIALALAHELSGFATATNVARDDIYSLYGRALSVAFEVNAKESPTLRMPQGEWVDVRLTGSTTDYWGG